MRQSMRQLPPADWNQDPEWVAYVLSLDPLIASIAAKFTEDEALREDIAQESRIALLTIYPERIRYWTDYQEGRLSLVEWKARLKRYVGNVIRNSMLSYLESLKTGNQYIGRTRRVRDKVTGKTRHVHVPARFDSLDELMDDSGLQVDHRYNISWGRVRDDGIAPAPRTGEEDDRS